MWSSAERHGERQGDPSQATRAPSETNKTTASSASGSGTTDKRWAMARRRYIDCGRVDFEKWHALGNDYLLIERQALPFELTPPRIRALCAPHTGVFADGILLLGEPVRPREVAELR